MKQARWFRVFGLAAIALVVSVTLTAQGDTAAIQQKLNEQFKLTTTTADRTDIVTAGDVVVIHKPGLLMYAVASPLPPSNSYKNGKIGQGWGGFGKDLAIGMMNGGNTPADTYPQRPFAPEEKCWVTGIQVQRDGVLFQLYSDPYDDIRYYANLKIPFPDKKKVPSVDIALQAVAEVLTADDQGGQQDAAPAADAATSPAQDSTPPPLAGEYTAPSGSRILLLTDGSFTKFVGGGQGHGQYVADGNNLTLTFTSTGFSQQFKIQGGSLLDVNTQQTWVRTGDVPAVAAAPMPEIAPPPPPADVAPPTIAVGQTRDQVKAAFGQPLRVAKIGTKEIYYYKDMKVTFLNGKVSNVQ